MKKYEQVKQAIKSFILNGKYLPHQRINSESELTVHFGVSRHTVRKAINDLVNEGWLYTEQGSGTYCADRETVSHSTEKTIALVTTYISNYIFPQIISGAESYLSTMGYNLQLYSTNNDVSKERMCLEKILGSQISGLIVEPTKSNYYNPNLTYYLNLERRKTPYLMLNAYYPELNPYSLTLDDESGGYLAVEHLLLLGHTRIAGLFKTDDLQGVRRMQGFIRAHRTYRVPILPEMIVSYTTKEKYTKAAELFTSLMKADVRPTGLFCYNDEVALSMLDIIREMGMNVPEDLSVVGFDDSNLATASEVKLTSVKHPQFEMGRQAAETIIQLIESKDQIGNPSILYKPELVIRKSTKKYDN